MATGTWEGTDAADAHEPAVHVVTSNQNVAVHQTSHSWISPFTKQIHFWKSPFTKKLQYAWRPPGKPSIVSPVEKRTINLVIPDLREAGATDLVEMPISKIVP